MSADLAELQNRILRHLKKHASDGRSILQRKQRNGIRAENAEIYNQAVIELVKQGLVEIDFAGPHNAKYIRLKLDDGMLEL